MFSSAPCGSWAISISIFLLKKKELINYCSEKLYFTIIYYLEMYHQMNFNYEVKPLGHKHNIFCGCR